MKKTADTAALVISENKALGSRGKVNLLDDNDISCRAVKNGRIKAVREHGENWNETEHLLKGGLTLTPHYSYLLTETLIQFSVEACKA